MEKSIRLELKNAFQYINYATRCLVVTIMDDENGSNSNTQFIIYVNSEYLMPHNDFFLGSIKKNPIFKSILSFYTPCHQSHLGYRMEKTKE